MPVTLRPSTNCGGYDHNLNTELLTSLSTKRSMFGSGAGKIPIRYVYGLAEWFQKSASLLQVNSQEGGPRQG